MEHQESMPDAANTAAQPSTRPRTVAVLAEMLFASRVRSTAESSGATAIIAARTDRFLEQAKSNRPRLLIVDLELRGQDVTALIRAIKADEALRDTPLIAFASHMNADAIAAGRAAGADRVLARSAFVQALPTLLGGL